MHLSPTSKLGYLSFKTNWPNGNLLIYFTLAPIDIESAYRLLDETKNEKKNYVGQLFFNRVVFIISSGEL